MGLKINTLLFFAVELVVILRTESALSVTSSRELCFLLLVLELAPPFTGAQTVELLNIVVVMVVLLLEQSPPITGAQTVER